MDIASDMNHKVSKNNSFIHPDYVLKLDDEKRYHLMKYLKPLVVDYYNWYPIGVSASLELDGVGMVYRIYVNINIKSNLFNQLFVLIGQRINLVKVINKEYIDMFQIEFGG